MKTVFSTGFFSIDTSQNSSTLVPRYPSLRYIWILLLASGLVSLSTWLVWWQRRKALRKADKDFRAKIQEPSAGTQQAPE